MSPFSKHVPFWSTGIREENFSTLLDINIYKYQVSNPMVSYVISLFTIVLGFFIDIYLFYCLLGAPFALKNI